MGAHTDILIVEDNRINAMVVTRIARDAGFSTETAATGRECLALLSGRRYRLVLMDLQLPDMSGIEVTRIVREQSSDVINHSIPIVALSAYTSDEDRRACENAGMNDYLEKPLDTEALLSVIERLLPGADGTATAETGDASSGATDPTTSSAGSPGRHSSLPALDTEELRSRLRSEKLARTVASGFLEYLDDRAKAIHEALEDGTYSEIRSAAHNLASPAANAGAVALRALLKDMEGAAAAGDAEAVRDAARYLDAEVAAAREAAQRFLARE